MIKGVKLVVVESPTKAKTLSRFLGQDYVIEATMGHVRDLPKSELGVDVERDFAPEYVMVEKRAETIKGLQGQALKAGEVILATDPDREGEAIAWHVQELIKRKSVRIVFHEITREAVEEALKHPGQVNLQLVQAQQARRVVDRLVGYKLSPLLWKKVRRGLSAGRVQSVAVKLVVEREKEIEAFKPQEYWEIRVLVDQGFWLELVAKVTNKDQAEKIKADLEKAEYRVDRVDRKSLTRASLPPFKTSTLQQAAASRFGWTSRRTMRAAQALYERGLITYHRTDSLSLSAAAAEKTRAYINSTYGREYVPEKARFFKTTSKLAQEAHEAIRPTVVNSKFEARNSKLEKDLQKLYELIWRRFVASQMASATFDRTTVEVEARNPKSEIRNYLLRADGIKMIFPGWTKVYGDKTEDQLLPDVKVGEKLVKKEVQAEQKWTQPPARYTEASLIKTLEKLGIGRPSTYAPTITTIQTRQYVEKKEQKFYSTPVGAAVTEFLSKYFPKIMDYQFTAQMEDDLDKIAAGQAKWVAVARQFYGPFAKNLGQVEAKAERVKVATEATGDKCPECGQGEVVIRLGRFGKFLSCSRFPECKYTANYVQKVAGMNCPKCDRGEVVLRRTKKGKQFYGCSRYPDCDWAAWKLGRKEKRDPD